MSTGTKVFINCLQHNHSLCFGRSTQCLQEQKFLSIVSSSSLFVDSSLVAAAAEKLLSLSWRQTYRYLVYLPYQQFPRLHTICDVAVAIPLYSYIDSNRNLFAIMSSSNSDFQVGENSCFGYQYEPEYAEVKLAAAAAFK
jgi:hypothetical protein